MSTFHVVGKVVDKVDLLRKKQLLWRLDVWPFAVFYGAWVSVILPSLDFVDACIVLGALSSSHILVCLFTAWSVDFKCFAYYSKVWFLLMNVRGPGRISEYLFIVYFVCRSKILIRLILVR